MKKIKKLLAMIMAMTMVLGMAISVSAAPGSAEIKIENAGDAAHFTYVQIIAPDPEERTGWTFVNGAGTAFLEAFEETDEQDVIDKLIAYKEGDTSYSGQFSIALSKIAASNIEYAEMENPQEVTSAGIYSIKGVEEGYIYNNMAAYVAFGEVEGGKYPTLIGTEIDVDAKRTPTTTTKSVEDPDKVVAIGDIVTYTIEAYVPYINPGDVNRKFYIYDDIENASYYLMGENSVAKVEMNGAEVDGANFNTNLSEDDIKEYGAHDLVIDLSDLIEDTNVNAGKKIVVTYTAKIDAVGPNNTAGTNVGGSGYDSEKVELYTGIITLKKVDEDDPTNLLAGAVFEVTKEGSNAKLTFREKETGVVGNYIYDPAGAITQVETGEEGKLIISGLDMGKYNFKEIEAPEGFHINNDPSGVDIGFNITLEAGKAEADQNIELEGTLTNSRLASLPSTGGIGTTIFTIGGCAIMIAAAALYFVNRRKSEEN